MQKRNYDINTEIGWDEGSSIFHALKVGKNVGFLPESEWTHTTLADRKLSYAQYIKKLKAIPDEEIERLKVIASKYKLSAYASVPIDRDTLANAISNTGALLVRFDIGKEFWTNPIEPLRSPIDPISGHAMNKTKYNGSSFRLANSWGIEWADEGTAYFLLDDYKPTEAWSVWFAEVPEEIEKKLENREKIIGQILDLIQKVINLLKN
jgi:hypothetical protein